MSAMSQRGPEPGPDTVTGPPDRLIILDQSIRVLYQSILVLSLYFLFVGHNLPGGGFVGGLTAGSAISLRYVSGGAEAVRSTFRIRSHLLLGIGLFVSSTTALVPVLLGGAVLEHGEYVADLPVFGDVKFTSPLSFDIGVFLVVIGLVLMAFAAFGDRAPTEEPPIDVEDDEGASG